MPAQTSETEDAFVFLEESAAPSSATAVETPSWQMLIVDDDADVHSSTELALSDVQLQHRPLVFLHAYSAAEARELLAHKPDVAVVLLDVVMEQQNAGLELVRHIRETLKMSEVRIILHTGQPGYAPEFDAIRDYDINDYKTKSELTRIKLFTAVTSAIRSFEQIRAINASRRGLSKIARASAELVAAQGLENFAAGVIHQLAGLLEIAPHGMFCSQYHRRELSTRYFVNAALGPYEKFSQMALPDLPDRRTAAALNELLRTRDNVYKSDHVGLFFAGKAGRDFVVLLNLPKALNATDQCLLEAFCSNIAVGFDNLALVNRLHGFAFYDELSRLPNRTHLVNVIDQALHPATRTDNTLALVDIDHFAETNDALGHRFGDSLLLAVAFRLQSRLGDKLIVARVGGDTFAVFGANRQVNPATIVPLFTTAFSIDGQEVQISATVGLVRLAEHEGSGADALKNANIALKRAKLQQRTGHFYFSRSMCLESRERVRLMHALRSAFEEEKLSIVYQPQIDLKSRRPTGVEALLRWQGDDGIFVSPDVFIPIAEYSGLIIELGEWVLRNACKELIRLRSAGHTDLLMSVNVSQVQFRHHGFLERLRRILRDTGVPPEFLELEITESVAMQDPECLIKTLSHIKQLGVSIAIDDFGTGFSSLSYLQQFRVDRLKIDRFFVAELTRSTRGSSIAAMVIQLGRNLGLSIVAEGVEDEDQADNLIALGCQLAQGNLFSVPMAPQQLHPWLIAASTAA